MSTLLEGFQARCAEILTASAKMFNSAMDELQTAHAEFSTEVAALGANTETQLKSRLAETLERHKDMLAHFTGVVPLREPVIAIRPPMPNVFQLEEKS